MAGINGFPGFISDFVRGTTRDFIIGLSRTVDGVSEPINLTGCKFFVNFAYDQNPDTIPELIIEIDPPTDPLNGRTLGKITDDETWSLNAGNVYYSVRWITSAGDAYVIDMAKIKVIEAIADQRS